MAEHQKTIEITRQDDLRQDLSGKHQPLQPGPERNTPEIDADFETLMRDGYVILHDLLSAEEIGEIKRESARLLGKQGRTTFEGLNTQRVYNVYGKTTCADALSIHPRVLGLLDRIFHPSYLMSQAQIINILPGEAAQMLHVDDGFYNIPRPRPPYGAAIVAAIDPFTEHNGATVIIPGSHTWGDDRQPQRDEAIPAVMPAGSAIFFLGTAWHGGGENRSNAARLALTCQYCEAYMRPQESFLLELSKERVRSMHPELQKLVGYSIYPPFMGMVDGQHPLRTLETE